MSGNAPSTQPSAQGDTGVLALESTRENPSVRSSARTMRRLHQAVLLLSADGSFRTSAGRYALEVIEQLAREIRDVRESGGSAVFGVTPGIRPLIADARGQPSLVSDYV
jgi:hypothetical protein